MQKRRGAAHLLRRRKAAAMPAGRATLKRSQMLYSSRVVPEVMVNFAETTLVAGWPGPEMG